MEKTRWKAHKDSINCLTKHPFLSLFASGSDDCTAKIWTIEASASDHVLSVLTSIKAIKCFLLQEAVTCVLFSSVKDDDRIWIAAGKRISLFSLSAKEVVCKVPVITYDVGEDEINQACVFYLNKLSCRSLLVTMERCWLLVMTVVAYIC